MANNGLFHLEKPFEPKGDQPAAIEELTKGILDGKKYHDFQRDPECRKTDSGVFPQ